MNKQDVLDFLEENKDYRGIKHWEKAGHKEMSSFGIGVTRLKNLAKKIGKNHPLALELWKENNFECKTISTLIDDPELIDREQINNQVGDVSFWMLSHAYCNYLLPKFSGIQELAEEWINSNNSVERRCGFLLLCHVAKNNKKLPDSYFMPLIERIENELQQEENFVKDAMNNFLFAVGSRNKSLNINSIKTAKNIGIVTVDYGDNSCKAMDVAWHLSSERLQKKLNT